MMACSVTLKPEYGWARPPWEISDIGPKSPLYLTWYVVRKAYFREQTDEAFIRESVDIAVGGLFQDMCVGLHMPPKEGWVVETVSGLRALYKAHPEYENPFVFEE